MSEASVTSFRNPSETFGQKASDATVTTINPLRSEFDVDAARIERERKREREESETGDVGRMTRTMGEMLRVEAGVNGSVVRSR